MKSILFVIIFMFFTVHPAFPREDIPVNNLSLPVLIKLSSGGTGSGFYVRINNNIYLATARHVLLNAPPQINIEYKLKMTKDFPKSIGKIKYYHDKDLIIFKGQMTKSELDTLIDWTEKEDLKEIFKNIYEKSQYKINSTSAILLSYSPDFKNAHQNKIEVNLLNSLKNGSLKFSYTHDVAIIEIGKFIENQKSIRYNKEIISLHELPLRLVTLQKNGIKKYNDILIGNEIFVFGFPSSLGLKKLPQFDYNRPLLRRGIVAGTNDNLKTIIIDCPIYFGNSGGPVIEVEHIDILKTNYRTIGLVSQYIPFVEIIHNKTQNYYNRTFSNSGYAVIEPIDYIIELIESNYK